MESLPAIAGASLERPAFTHRAQRINGKLRQIAAPNWAMRLLHWSVIERLRTIDLGLLLHNSYGAMGRGSVVANASRHAGNRYVYQLDITDAYPSLPLDRLTDALHWLDPTLGDPVEIDSFLQTYCAGETRGLAVGGPASPILFDLYCASEIDARIRRAFPRATYTRYLDDLTISQEKPIPSIMRKRIREVVQEARLSVNHRKSFVTDRHRWPVTITGVVITRRGMIRPTEDFMRKVRAAARLPISSITEEQRDEVRGLVGHLFQFTDQKEWPFGRVSRDVKHLQQRLLGKINMSRRVQRSGNLRYFSRQFLDEVRMVPLQEVIRPFVQKMRPYGNEFNALCPYHMEKTGSFTVSPEKGFYHCFGCAAHGDVIEFVMEFERCTFPEAVYNIAARFGLNEY